jgi:hypothetical protein
MHRGRRQRNLIADDGQYDEVNEMLKLCRKVQTNENIFWMLFILVMLYEIATR